MPFINADFSGKTMIFLAFSGVLCYNIYSTKRRSVSRMSVQNSTKNEQLLAQENAALRNEISRQHRIINNQYKK